MQKGDVLELTIESVGMDGEGVAKQDGMVIFVPFTLVGEVVKCEVTFVKKSFAKAKVIKLIKGAEDRVQPLCPHFRKCGGCDMQHITYLKQLDIKRENVKNCFKKYAGEQVQVNEVIPSDNVFYYRNKAQFPLFEKDGKVCLGFYKEKTHEFVKIDKCYLLSDWCDKFTQSFLKVANELKLSCYNEKTHSGLLRHLVLRKLNDVVSVTVVVNSKKFNYTDKFVKELSKIGIKFSFYVSHNTDKTNLIMSNAYNLYGDKDIKTDILGITTFVNPMSFMQINDYIRDKIYTKVSELVGDSNSKIVIDAYSGVGVLTNILAQCADKVYGIEIVPQAVQNADQLAEINGNQNKIVNICGDSAVELPKLADKIRGELMNVQNNGQTTSSVNSKQLNDSFTVVLDPPRKGCDTQVLESLLKAQPNKIIYISCNPATLARDVAILKHNYQLSLIQPYDMFPQTSHIETLVCLDRKDS